MQKQPAIYIMANKKNGTLYMGVTSRLDSRGWQHRNGEGSDFTKRYDCKLLVYTSYTTPCSTPLPAKNN
jgi:putative endonuclease